MHAEYSNSGALALLFSLNVKFVNTFQKNTEYFSTNNKFLGILATNSRLSSNNREDIQSTSLKLRYTMFKGRILCWMLNFIFILGHYLAHNTVSIITIVSLASARTLQKTRCRKLERQIMGIYRKHTQIFT
jgi:hypothetical protein